MESGGVARNGAPIVLELGAAAELVPVDPAQLTRERVEFLAALGVRCLVTHFPLAELTLADAERIRGMLDNAGLRVVQAAGFRTSLVEPDAETRLAGIARLEEIFQVASALGAEMFITGCGSLNPAGFYAPTPENHTRASRDRLIDSLRRAALIAEKQRLVLALECHQLTTLDTPETIRALLDAVGSAWVKANFDPVNLLGDLRSVYRSGDAMRHMCEVVGPHYAKSAHIKDVTVDLEYPLHLSEDVPGDGYLDLPAFFEVCRALGEGTAVIVEHLPFEKALTAVERVRKAAATAGASFA